VANQLTDADHGKHVLGHYGYIDLQPQMVTAPATDCHPHPFPEKSDAGKTRRKTFRLGSLPEAKPATHTSIARSKRPIGLPPAVPGKRQLLAAAVAQPRTLTGHRTPPVIQGRQFARSWVGSAQQGAATGGVQFSAVRSET